MLTAPEMPGFTTLCVGVAQQSFFVLRVLNSRSAFKCKCNSQSKMLPASWRRSEILCAVGFHPGASKEISPGQTPLGFYCLFVNYD